MHCHNININYNIFNNKYQYNTSFGNQKRDTISSNYSVKTSYESQMRSFLDNSIIIDIPQVSDDTKIVKDIYPITNPHLILVHPKDKILSLAEIDKDNSFISDLENIKTY